MKMRLSELLCYDEITIQCHDIPDADSIGAGYGLYRYFLEHGKPVRMIYSGRSQMTKPNLLCLVKELQIPLGYVEDLKVSGLLITVDCQYGAGNVKKLEAEYTAIIDHHQQEITDVPLCEIRSFLGSCSTLVWQMLEDEGFKVSLYPDVSTALYYGLLSDTNSFTEIHHPTDRDMQDTLDYNSNLIRKLKNSNLTMHELEIAGIALLRSSYNASNRFSVVKTHPCDPNILGFISDLALQVDSIDVCIVYHEVQTGIKYSVRSCIREVMASELAAYLSEGIGSGGGHRDKAGGFISQCEFNRHYPGVNTDQYLLTHLTAYFGSFDVIDCAKDKLDFEPMKRYKKLSLDQGYVCCTDVFPKGTPIILRTLQCDMDDLVAEDDIYIVIGLKGEVHPISREKFSRSYKPVDEPYEVDTEYFPHIRSKATGHIVNLRPYAKKCIPTGDVYIYAKALTRTTKVFTVWDKDSYMLGKPGDYLVAREDDPQDIYTIPKDMFDAMYQEI